MKKKYFSSLIATTVVSVLTLSPFSYAEELPLKTVENIVVISNKAEVTGSLEIIDGEELTPQQIEEQFKEIDAKYKIGEEFSMEDAEFVKKYAKKPGYSPEGVGNVTRSVFGVGKGGGIRAESKGTARNNIGVINNSFGATFTTATTSGGAKVISIRNEVSITAYGAVGSGGIGKVYQKTLSNTCKKSSCTFNEYEGYSGSVAYATVYVKAVVSYSGGSFTINPRYQ
ncbi:hypothetical protein [Hazenella coriacea]|uniref:Uncharacterized protein n=1 Tax=Hazenella coriacea TaxID=1179467 RepID=A0A4R3L985_9BACL|nr:hypothetical protein [Hazenella coriacea]TCS95778.1 hypothetical protein EDD58_102359 [Hazenella coriacea]